MSALTNRSFAIVALVSVAVLLCSNVVAAQAVVVGQTMPDFTLPSLQGDEVTLSDLRAKTVILVFPRGRSGGGWCHVCHYQYAELAELEEQQGVRAAHDVEILFVLPYEKARVQEWVEMFPAQLKDIEDWKNPPDPASLDERGRSRMEAVRRYYPKTFTYEPGNIPLPFPVLIDGDRSVSERIGLFTNSWSGADAEQNVPTVFIIDGEGTVRFKYHSQTTVDRPSPEYLMEVIEKLVQ